jgi:hypothetical protein
VQSSQKGISRPKWSDLFSDRNYPNKPWHLSTKQSFLSARLLLPHGRSTHPERSLYPEKEVAAAWSVTVALVCFTHSALQWPFYKNVSGTSIAGQQWGRRTLR